MTIEAVDWPLIDLVDIEVEPTERYADERYVFPVFSRTPHYVWATAFVEFALFDESITWDAVQGAVLTDVMAVEGTLGPLANITGMANVAFCWYIESVQTENQAVAARLLEDEAEGAVADRGVWSRLTV